MKSHELEEKIEETIRAIRASYKDKYREEDYQDFRMTAKAQAKNLKHLVILVENLFDLDHADAHDMVH